MILRSIIERLNASLRGTVASIRWKLTPYYSIEMSPNRPETVLIRQQFDFAASHRLHAPTLSDAGNRAMFGKCNNPGGHGHNYRVEPCVEVRMGPAGASPFGLSELENITARTIIDRFDHKNLNQDTSDFGGDTGRNPSVENIAKVCFEILGPAVSNVCSEARLKCITVWETDKTSCTYPG